MEIIGTNVYTVHQRVARRWREGNVFLMGDAAHLITPMWALGLNTGVLDASNMPWRLAWVLRGWAAPSLLDGYEREQGPVAIRGSGQMAEAARAYMDRRGTAEDAAISSVGGWGNAITRSLLGVRLDVDGNDDWSMIQDGDGPAAVRAGDRAPDLPLFGHDGQAHVHDLADDTFVALYFTDTRRRPRIPQASAPGLRRYVVSRWFGVAGDTVVLIRPDSHVAAIVPFDPASDADVVGELYAAITGIDADPSPLTPRPEALHGE
jgi:3-(3-hydroxy-phenyl)propionate hydroxylase